MIGMKFRVRPAFTKGPVGLDNTSQTGTVVYVHPQERYVVLEFEGEHGKPRECFSLWELLHKKNKQEGTYEIPIHNMPAGRSLPAKEIQAVQAVEDLQGL